MVAHGLAWRAVRKAGAKAPRSEILSYLAWEGLGYGDG